MSSEWDMPVARAPGSAPASAAAGDAPGQRFDGLVHPLAFFRFLLANAVRIGIVALAVTVAGLLAVSLMNFPFNATATVLVDPRKEQVVLQEGVLSPIGSDAAILESMVQIMRSDGFLLAQMDELGLFGEAKPPLPEDARLRALADFKRRLTVERKGATYLVEVSFSDGDPQQAARIANSVANGFAETQNGYLADATRNAAQALSERLVELRAKVSASEKAVSDFAAEKGIVYVDNDSTLQMRQLGELSAQLALARTATEEARARYEQQVAASRSGQAVSDERGTDSGQLAFLRQQRTQLMQALEQQNLTYGARHPRIAATRRLLDGIDRQIADERRVLLQRLKGELDVAAAHQSKLESDITGLSAGVTLTDAEQVKLEALRREAAADREIYESFLSRNKATDELAQIKSDTVRVVSPAVPPLRSSRPSLTLLAPVFGLLGGVLGTVLVVLAGGPAPAAPGRRAEDEAADAPDTPPAPEAPLVAAQQREAAARRRRPPSLLAMAPAPRARRDLRAEPSGGSLLDVWTPRRPRAVERGRY